MQMLYSKLKNHWGQCNGSTSGALRAVSGRLRPNVCVSRRLSDAGAFHFQTLLGVARNQVHGVVVQRRICLCLAVYAARSVPHEWPGFWPELFALSDVKDRHHEQRVCLVTLCNPWLRDRSLNPLLQVLEVLVLIPEVLEQLSASMASDKRIVAADYLNGALEHVKCTACALIRHG
jgi:hypothetical protein